MLLLPAVAFLPVKTVPKPSAPGPFPNHTAPDHNQVFMPFARRFAFPSGFALGILTYI